MILGAFWMSLQAENVTRIASTAKIGDHFIFRPVRWHLSYNVQRNEGYTPRFA
jgi:hypothetical protein